jgi:hypothetical protein
LFHSWCFLFRESSNTEGNWQADCEHVDRDAEKQVVKFVRTVCVKRRERQLGEKHFVFPIIHPQNFALILSTSFWSELILDDFSVFHHEANSLEFCNVGDRIAGNSD